MAKSVKKKSIVPDQSYEFLKNDINTPSPTGFESKGQKLWMEYL